jgi:hypothetical protein
VSRGSMGGSLTVVQEVTYSLYGNFVFSVPIVLWAKGSCDNDWLFCSTAIRPKGFSKFDWANAWLLHGVP